MRISVIGLAALVLSGCATLEPDPCTPDWVQWQTSQITDRFSSQYRSELRDMRQFAQKLENPSPLLLLEMSARLQEFRTIAADFSSEVVPQLRGSVDQCGAPTEFATAFSGFLQEQGMPDTVLTWIEEIALTMEMLSTEVN